MYPMSDDSLPLAEIAKHWSRDFSQRPPVKEIEDRLLEAVWKGQLRVRGGRDVPLTPKALLRIVSRGALHPRILIVRDPGALQPEAEELPDGTLLFDVATRVYLPGDDASWTPEIVRAACASLAQCKISDYDEAVVRPILKDLDIGRDDFAAFCDAQGYERPAFWFRLAPPKPSSFPGRPSIMAALEKELRCRAADGQIERTLHEQAKALHDWAERAFAGQQIPGVRSIENGLRVIYRALRSQTGSIDA